ncbi:uncharacterized protein LOC119985150 [Tripterygium wilfordii]|uniref:uncharacterized protein LOC119985150 n=1 Tax=Tripterygium wilfordii TaxID=458696 RepID=UPI0018F7FAF7|nr:uncharacterized protein LOC119985150 [Tripterygium wilfordii]
MPDYYVELKAELEGDLTEIEPFWGWENIDQELMCISPVCSRCHCSFHYLVVSLSKYESPERFETADGHFTDALQLQLGRQQSLYRFGVEVGKARVTASFVDA